MHLRIRLSDDGKACDVEDTRDRVNRVLECSYWRVSTRRDELKDDCESPISLAANDLVELIEDYDVEGGEHASTLDVTKQEAIVNRVASHYVIGIRIREVKRKKRSRI